MTGHDAQATNPGRNIFRNIFPCRSACRGSGRGQTFEASTVVAAVEIHAAAGVAEI